VTAGKQQTVTWLRSAAKVSERATFAIRLSTHVSTHDGPPTQFAPETARLEAWVRFLRTHAALTRDLSADLVAEHGLTINDYEVLLYLARSPERMLRRVDLAERVLLTASGITRLLEGLERAGLVERADSQSDRRVVYAKLTPAGARKLREASLTHLSGIDQLFTGHFSEEELATLSSLLARLPGGAGAVDESECTGED
jgi:DNA-binding MarR family transcriptional regulator